MKSLRLNPKWRIYAILPLFTACASPMDSGNGGGNTGLTEAMCTAASCPMLSDVGPNQFISLRGAGVMFATGINSIPDMVTVATDWRRVDSEATPGVSSLSVTTPALGRVTPLVGGTAMDGWEYLRDDLVRGYNFVEIFSILDQNAVSRYIGYHGLVADQALLNTVTTTSVEYTGDAIGTIHSASINSAGVAVASVDAGASTLTANFSTNSADLTLKIVAALNNNINTGLKIEYTGLEIFREDSGITGDFGWRSNVNRKVTVGDVVNVAGIDGLVFDIVSPSNVFGTFYGWTTSKVATGAPAEVAGRVLLTGKKPSETESETIADLWFLAQ